MKRTIVKLLIILATLFISVGSTVAYLTDVDKEVNVMTLDRVEIDLIEQERNAAGILVDFQDNHPLYPGYYPKGIVFDSDGYYMEDYVHNAVDKIVSVKNTGKAPAYVRLWFAFEFTGDVSFFDNMIHLNRNMADWQWVFLKNTDGSYAVLKQNNTYYVVATATYSKVLPANSTTPVSLRQVLLDSSVTNDDLLKLGDKYSILVVAQGMQSAGFDSSWEALNEGFGVPSLTTHPFAGMEKEVITPKPPASNATYGEAKHDDVRVLDAPQKDATALFTINTGYEFVIVDLVIDSEATRVTWLKVLCANPADGIAYTGYVAWTDIVFGITPDGNESENVDEEDIVIIAIGMIVNIDQVNVRTEPDKSSTSMGKLKANDLVEIITIPAVLDSDHWFKVRYDGKVGYIQAPYVYIEGLTDSPTDTPDDPIASPASDFKWEKLSDGSGILITQYLGDDETVVIPAVINGAPVVQLGDYIFSPDLYENNSLKSITIPSSVPKLYAQSFSMCPNLESIAVASDNPMYRSVDGVLYSKDMQTLIKCPEGYVGTLSIPEGTTKIGSGALNSCLKLTDIVIPSTITYLDRLTYGYFENLTNIYIADDNPKYKVIDRVVFTKDMKELVWFPAARSGTYTVPEGVQTIGPSAFEYAQLDNVKLPQSLLCIENQAFSNCTELINITIPENVHTIGYGAFSGCDSLKSFNIPANITSIDMEFFGGRNLTDLHVSPANPSYTAIDNVMYTKDMKSLLWCPLGKTGTLTIPEGVETIKAHTVEGCWELSGVILPDSLQVIEAWAFSNCTSLKSVVIPGKNTLIAGNAFSYCTNLSAIQVATNNQYHTTVDGVLFTKDMTTLLTCPGAKKGAYRIPDGVTKIEEYAFAYCSDLTEITIPHSVTTIIYCAFDGCSSLQTITLPTA